MAVPDPTRAPAVDSDRSARIGQAERRLAALEAQLGSVQQGGTIPVQHRAAPSSRTEWLRQQPTSTWWFVGAGALLLVAILLAVV